MPPAAPLVDGSSLPPDGAFFWPSLVLGLLAAGGLAAWFILRALREAGRAGTELMNGAGDVAIRVADGLAARLRSAWDVDPRVRIAGVTHSLGTVAARELVTVRQTLTRTHAWTNTRFWSTKRLSLTATFTVRAGFDLSRPIEIEVGADGAATEVRWPAPRILSVHIEHLEPAREETGWWNRITAEDRAAVQQEMQRFVERDAAEGGLLARAEAELRQWLQEQARPTGTSLRLDFEPLPSLPGAPASAEGHPGRAALPGPAGTTV